MTTPALQETKQHQENFFNSTGDAYWTAYLAARPVYPKSLYDRVYEHHRKHGSNTWNIAHDVGAGPGNVAAELSNDFDKVVVSDSNGDHVISAQDRLAVLCPDKQFEFVHSRGEDVSNDTGYKGTVDLVVAAESICLMDAERALSCFAELLRPRGTLAIWFYGRPAFVNIDDPMHERQQYLLGRILSRMFSKFRPMKETLWEPATNRMFSWIDDVAISSDQWTNVTRYKWNEEFPFCMYDEDALDFEVQKLSRIGDHEEIKHIKDRYFLKAQWNIEGVRRWIQTNLPGFEKLERDEQVEQWYTELAEVMGENDEKKDITWPVVLILAVRK